MSPTDMISILGTIISVISVKPLMRAKLLELVNKITLGASDEDQKKLAAFCKLLETRRVFYLPFSSEDVDLCIHSLGWVQNEVTKCLADVEHAGGQAALEAIQDNLRWFMDRWAAIHRHGPIEPSQYDHKRAEFFRDLGILRERVRLGVEAIRIVAPSAVELPRDEGTVT